MRAGYSALMLAALGSVAFGAVVTSAIAPRTTIRAALGLDGPDAPGLDARRDVAVERLVAQCMARRGHAYVPLPGSRATVPDAALDPVAWAERWGFGVSTSPRQADIPETSTFDPNRVHASRLGPRGERRYHVALDGHQGCRSIALDAVHGLRERLLRPLARELAALDARISEDPTMPVVLRAWRTCIDPAADAIGVPPADRRRDRFVPVALDLLVRRAAAIRTDDDASRRRLAASERRAATLAARCEEAYAAGRAGVALAHEAAFVRAHGHALRRIAAAIRAAEASLPVLPAPP